MGGPFGSNLLRGAHRSWPEPELREGCCPDGIGTPGPEETVRTPRRQTQPQGHCVPFEVPPCVVQSSRRWHTQEHSHSPSVPRPDRAAEIEEPMKGTHPQKQTPSYSLGLSCPRAQRLGPRHAPSFPASSITLSKFCSYCVTIQVLRAGFSFSNEKQASTLSTGRWGARLGGLASSMWEERRRGKDDVVGLEFDIVKHRAGEGGGVWVYQAVEGDGSLHVPGAGHRCRPLRSSHAWRTVASFLHWHSLPPGASSIFP